MTTNIPDPASVAGIAASVTEAFVPPAQLFSNPEDLRTTIEPVGQNTTLAYGSVVGRSGGNLVLAVKGTTEAIGVLLVAVATGAGQTTKATVARSGDLNPDAAVWDASYDTAEKKRLAFEALGNPIFVKAPSTPSA